ncbi:unnamed protein product [Rhizoctonia solani]|uniref:F-box domain-containing protein n=1 Tax=Rhizoctonia solani TaxID=456999 RepID=A0A8H3I294_9AGAM|nr:unnamed protein product [Rhizoctonia solani]
MSASNYHLSSSAIKRLEESSASLVVAIKSHLSMCQTLAADLLRDGAKPEEVAASIDSTLEPAYTAMSHHLDEVRYTIKRTRNEFTSPVFRFPPEVMSKIFENAVFDPRDSKTSNLLPISQHIWVIYRRLHELFGVCSTWRNIILSTGVLWSIIPIEEDMPTPRSDLFELRLKRAGENKLYLAVALDSSPAVDLSNFLIPHYNRFHAISISANDEATITSTLNMLLRQKNHRSLSQLSIQLESWSGRMYNDNETTSACVVPDKSLETSFKDLIGELTVFRISRITFHWDTMSFSTRLVELRIDHAKLGTDDMLVQFMQALSSASELRDLKILCVETHHPNHAASDTVTPLPVTFPKLQSLYIQDVYFNTLKTLLSMVTPGSHHLTLDVTDATLTHADLQVDHNNGDLPNLLLNCINITDLYTILRLNPVHTLMVWGGSGSDEPWLSGSAFLGLLEAMPTLETLKMHHWHFDEGIQTDLNRRTHPQLPQLKNLHLTSVSISNPNILRDMMATHPLRQVVLGGTIVHAHTGGPSDYHEPLQESSLVQWLEGNVPDFCLVDSAYFPPGFILDEWRQW